MYDTYDIEKCKIVETCAYATKTPTNADRIRAMSDEELVELLISADFCGACDYRDKELVCRYYEAHPCGEIDDGCKQAAKNWLQQPAEDSEDEKQTYI